jgi:hypothetical protein
VSHLCSIGWQSPEEEFISDPENDLLFCIIPVPETKNYTIRAIIRELNIIGVTSLFFPRGIIFFQFSAQVAPTNH